MAKTSDVVKTQKLLRKRDNCFREGVRMKFMTRVHYRCELCGRRHGYMRKFGFCRICFRERANRGEIAGVTKSSW